MKKKPYIGVTGFMSPDEVNETLRDINFKKANRLLMVGVLASAKTLVGQTNKWPNRYPKWENVKNIFQENDNCLNLIHFNTKEPDQLTFHLNSMTDAVGPKLHGFQLNIAWPNPESIARYKDVHPDKVIVLQVGGHAFSMVNHEPEMVEDMVKSYLGLIDYVLLDPSGGLGQELNPFAMRDYLLALAKHEKQIGLGVAGGLSAGTVKILEPLIKDYPNLSIDAEGRLRTEIGDNLNVPVTRGYIQQSLDLFERVRLETMSSGEYTPGES